MSYKILILNTTTEDVVIDFQDAETKYKIGSDMTIAPGTSGLWSTDEAKPIWLNHKNGGHELTPSEKTVVAVGYSAESTDFDTAATDATEAFS